MAATLLLRTHFKGLEVALRELDGSPVARKPNVAPLDPSRAPRRWKSCSRTGRLAYGARVRMRVHSKQARNFRAAGLKSLFGQRTHERTPERTRERTPDDSRSLLRGLLVEKKKEVPKEEASKNVLQTWVPTVQTFFSDDIMIPPAYRVATVLAWVVAAYFVATVSSEVLERLDAIPLLPQFESVLGVLLVSQFVTTYIIQDSGKARLESMVEGILERIAGQDLKGEDEVGPRMLEVQLHSLLDSQVPTSHNPHDENALLKQTLVTSLMSFILERESKARRINSVLRKDVDEERARVAKLKQAVALYAEKEASLLAEVEHLTSSTKALRAERDSARASIVHLNARLESTSAMVESVSSDRNKMDNLNAELKSRVTAIMAENKRLSDHVSSLEGAQEEAASELRAARSAADATVSDNRTLQERIRTLENEKDEILSALEVARRGLGETEKAQAEAPYVTAWMRNSVDNTSSAELAVAREELERCLQSSQGEVAALEKSLDTLTNEKGALEAQLKDADAAMARGAEDLRAQIADLESALAEAREERAAARARVAVLENLAQESSRDDIDRLEAALADAVQQLAAQGVRWAEMETGYEKELEARKSRIEAQAKELEGVQQKKVAAEEGVAAVEARLVELEESRRFEVEGLRARVAALQSEDGRARAAGSELEQRLEELEGREERDGEAATALAAELEGAHEARRAAEGQLADALAALAAADAFRRTEVETLRAEVDAWRKAERTAIELVRALEGQLEGGPGVDAALLAAYERALEAKQGEIRALEATLASNAAGYQSAKGEKEGLRTERFAPVAKSPPLEKDNGSEESLSPELKARLIAYNHEVREKFVDLTKTAKEQSEGVQGLIDALVKEGATESWARAYVIRMMSYERAKARKQRH